MIRSRAMATAARFLVGIDFSDGARHALSEARRLASRCRATLTLAHARPFSDVRAAVLEDRGDLLRAGGRALANEIREHYATRLRSWSNAAAGERILLLRGAPDVALTREARRGYSLLVLGTHGANEVAALFLGSTVERAIARATVPILAVPSPRRSKKR